MLQLNNISKKYKSNVVLNNISYLFTEGVTAILGANGVGKTTLLNIIATVLQSDSGEISFNGVLINENISRYRAQIGFVPQKPPFYPAFTGYEFLEYIALLKEFPQDQICSEIKRVIEVVRMENHINKKIKSYSGGMKQRISIAQALIGDPHILILDEPTTGLDPKERKIFIDYVEYISSNKIILLSTHIVSDIEIIANNIILLKSGTILYEGKEDEIIKRHKKEHPTDNNLFDIFIRMYD